MPSKHNACPFLLTRFALNNEISNSVLFDFKAKEKDFHMKIDENGEKFVEEVKVDVAGKTEEMAVPQHADRLAVDVLNDFNVVSFYVLIYFRMGSELMLCDLVSPLLDIQTYISTYPPTYPKQNLLDLAMLENKGMLFSKQPLILAFLFH